MNSKEYSSPPNTTDNMSLGGLQSDEVSSLQNSFLLNQYLYNNEKSLDQIFTELNSGNSSGSFESSGERLDMVNNQPAENRYNSNEMIYNNGESSGYRMNNRDLFRSGVYVGGKPTVNQNSGSAIKMEHQDNYGNLGRNGIPSMIRNNSKNLISTQKNDSYLEENRDSPIQNKNHHHYQSIEPNKINKKNKKIKIKKTGEKKKMSQGSETGKGNDYTSDASDDEDKLYPNGRKRASKACLECRKRHTRCGFERPCERCTRLGLECVDTQPTKKRGRSKKKVSKMGSTSKINATNLKKMNEQTNFLSKTPSNDSSNSYTSTYLTDDISNSGSSNMNNNYKFFQVTNPHNNGNSKSNYSEHISNESINVNNILHDGKTNNNSLLSDIDNQINETMRALSNENTNKKNGIQFSSSLEPNEDSNHNFGLPDESDFEAFLGNTSNDANSNSFHEQNYIQNNQFHHHNIQNDTQENPVQNSSNINNIPILTPSENINNPNIQQFFNFINNTNLQQTLVDNFSTSPTNTDENCETQDMEDMTSHICMNTSCGYNSNFMCDAMSNNDDLIVFPELKNGENSSNNAFNSMFNTTLLNQKKSGSDLPCNQKPTEKLQNNNQTLQNTSTPQNVQQANDLSIEKSLVDSILDAPPQYNDPNDKTPSIGDFFSEPYNLKLNIGLCKNNNNLFRNNTGMLISTDIPNIKFINNSLLRKLGYSRPEEIRSYFDIFVPLHLNFWLQNLKDDKQRRIAIMQHVEKGTEILRNQYLSTEHRGKSLLMDKNRNIIEISHKSYRIYNRINPAKLDGIYFLLFWDN